jgi:HD-GYP domain-containing protein (c-di-GMP phosphodiesterase class II)
MHVNSPGLAARWSGTQALTGISPEELARETAAVMRALEERDDHTAAHCTRTCALARAIGHSLGLLSDELRVLELAAMLHDVGKIGIPDRILLKPGRLDAEELRVMRTHPRRGYEILSAVPDAQINAVAAVALCHHEAVDGSGYPNGLSGDAIPDLARIVAVADAYDAIAAARPYHQPRTHAQVMRILMDENGHQYDVEVLSKFVRIIESSAHRAPDQAT